MDDWDCLTKTVVPIVKRSWLGKDSSEKSIAMTINDKRKSRGRSGRSASGGSKYLISKNTWNNMDNRNPVQKGYWPKGLNPYVLIIGIYKNRPKPAYVELEWVTCEKLIMPIEMCENHKKCPFLKKNKFLSDIPENQFWYDIDKHCMSAYETTSAWVCYLNDTSIWDDKVFERHGANIIKLWHEWMGLQDPENDMVKAEGQRMTWTINDTLWANGVGGSRLHPVTLNYSPRPGLSLELANHSGIVDYILNNITEQQYRSAIVLYCMGWSSVLRVTHTNQGIWKNHSDASNKGTLRWIGLSNFLYREWDVFPVAMGLDKTSNHTITWRSFNNHKANEDIFPITFYYRHNRTVGLNSHNLAHGYWSTKYYIPMMKPSELRYGNYRVMMASSNFDVKTSQPFSRNSLRPEILDNDQGKIRSSSWNFGLGRFEFRRDEDVKYLWFPGKEQYCSSEMFDSWKVKTPGTRFSPNISWMHEEEHIFCTFKDLMRIGATTAGDAKAWYDISSITSAAPLMMIAQNQVMKKCALARLVNSESELKGFFFPIDDFIEGFSVGPAWVYVADLSAQLIKPNRGDIFTVYWKIQKKAILWVVDNVKDFAVSVWDLIAQYGYYIKIVIICLTIIIVIIVILVMVFKSTKLGLVCRKLSKESGSAKNSEEQEGLTSSNSK
ncbi:hypothetical protein PO909_003892 [Leuciscus waleckii]